MHGRSPDPHEVIDRTAGELRQYSVALGAYLAIGIGVGLVLGWAIWGAL